MGKPVFNEVGIIDDIGTLLGTNCDGEIAFFLPSLPRGATKIRRDQVAQICRDLFAYLTSPITSAAAARHPEVEYGPRSGTSTPAYKIH